MSTYSNNVVHSVKSVADKSARYVKDNLPTNVRVAKKGLNIVGATVSVGWSVLVAYVYLKDAEKKFAKLGKQLRA